MVSYSIRNIIIGYAIAIAVVLLILGFTFYNLRSQEKELVKITKARKVLQKLEPGLIDIQEFESDLDRLLFLGKDKYQDSYKEGLEKLRADSLLLAQLSATYPEMSNESRQLTGLIHEIISFSADVIQSGEIKNPDSTSGQWGENAGNRIVTDFKAIVGKLEEENRNSLSRSYGLTMDLTRRTLTFVSIISGALILALLISFRVSYRDIQNRLNYNRDLVKQVDEKTAEIKNNELRFRTLTSNAPVGIFQTDAGGKTTYVNDTWLGYTGMTFEEALGEGWVEAVHPDDRQGLATQWYQRSEKGVESSSEYRLVDKKGNIRWVSGKAVPLFNKSGEIAGYMGTLSDITERKRAEEDLAQSYKSIRQLTDHLQNIREEERTNIAREIHDELGQQLTVLKMDLSWLSKKINLDDDMVNQKMNGLKDMLDSTVKTVRKIASELRPSLLDDLGLIAAMEWHLKEFEDRSGIDTEFFETEAAEPSVPRAIKTGLYRIFQESLTNVARHAGAKKVCISLQQNDDVIVLKIEDDGIGFDAKKAAAQKTLGILGMEERTVVMGGSYTISSKPGKGTKVEVSVPVNQQ